MSKLVTINAKDQTLGRLSTRVALLLQGKDSPEYAPNKVISGKVKVINISKVKLTGKKIEDKVYKRHSGYLGGLKVRKFGEFFEKRPEDAFRKIVGGMLPKNRLLKERLNKLIIER